MNAPSTLFACSATFVASPGEVFDMFTNHIGRWWPMARSDGSREARDIVIEPRPKGRFYEARRGTSDEPWGTIVACAAPRTLIIDLELDPQFRPGAAPKTSLEIFFMEQGDGSTHLTIIHADLDRFGSQAETARQKFVAGWRHILHAFATFLETERPRGSAQRPFRNRKSSSRTGLY